MRSSKGFLLLGVLCLIIAIASCRRNQPSLIDRNQAPETELWYAPPDSTDYEYLVHIYWRGLDKDGAVMKYIWTITDTIEAQEEKRWNPADRIEDYMRGRLTTRTDSVFSFTAYKNVGGIGLKKNRQAFHIAAIDDNGVIDPTPAAIEFVATIDKLPKIQFSRLRIGRPTGRVTTWLWIPSLTILHNSIPQACTSLSPSFTKVPQPMDVSWRTSGFP